MSTTSPLQNMLFYSVKCQHSIALLQFIKVNVPVEIANNIVFYCIDNPQIKIPPFIKVVPSFYIPSQRAVVTDKDIVQWFNMTTQKFRANMAAANNNSAINGDRQMYQQQLQMNQNRNMNNTNVINNADITGDPSISAYLPSEMSHGSGINYTYIDDNEGVGKDFFHIGMNETNIPEDKFNNKGMMNTRAFTRPPNEGEVRPRTESELTETLPIRQGPPPPQGGGPMIGGNVMPQQQQQSMTYNPNVMGQQSSMTYNPNIGNMGGMGGGASQTLPFEQIKVEKGSKGGSAKLQYQQLMASRNEGFGGGQPRY